MNRKGRNTAGSAKMTSGTGATTGKRGARRDEAKGGRKKQKQMLNKQEPDRSGINREEQGTKENSR